MVNPSGMPTGEWYDYLRGIAVAGSTADELSSEIDALSIRVDAIESTGRIAGAASVVVSGGSVKTVSLVNDQASPEPWNYYGTDPSGAKGFVEFPDNLQQVSGISGTGFVLVDGGVWQQRIFLVTGDLTLNDDGTYLTIGAETYPPELGFGGV